MSVREVVEGAEQHLSSSNQAQHSYSLTMVFLWSIILLDEVVTMLTHVAALFGFVYFSEGDG